MSFHPGAAHELVAAYHSAADQIAERADAIESLVAQATELLGTTHHVPALSDLSQQLRTDGDDLDTRLRFVERTDQLRLDLRAFGPVRIPDWRIDRAADSSLVAIAQLFATAQSPDEFARIAEWVFTTDDFDIHSQRRWLTAPQAVRNALATSLTMAVEAGWWDESMPPWLAAGAIVHGDPNDDALLTLARHTLTASSLGNQTFATSAFGIEASGGIFGPAADLLVRKPDLARRFTNSLLDDHDRTGDTVLNIHEVDARAQQLAGIIAAAGGRRNELNTRVEFVDRLVRTINADGDTNEPVFWMTWALHADLVLENEIETTTPTFDHHRLLPDAVRSRWQQAWFEHISPAALSAAAHWSQASVETFDALFSDESLNNRPPPPPRPGNDAGETYSSRLIAPFAGLDTVASPADRGRSIVTHALRDASPGGPIAADEFAIINHGTGVDGRSSFTVTLPGVIDLSTPVANFDPVHASVRDMDRVAIHSAPTARVEDNLYAQMVIRALHENGIESGSNIMIVGHSFGADTALDIAASASFLDDYNVTHVVASGYHALPQVAAIDPQVNVLVLQNRDDRVIRSERFHRDLAVAPEAVSVNTFAHTVRLFRGGTGRDLGHHPDRYIAEIETTTDDKLLDLFESIDAAGFTRPGMTRAIDISLDTSLLDNPPSVTAPPGR